MAAEVHLDHGREPSKSIAIAPPGNRKAVSERFISAATACIQLAGWGSCRRHTAAGFPKTGGL